MFLVDDDQAKLLKRQKKRRPRADHHLRRPLPDHAPDPAAFSHGDARMPFGGPRTEPLFDTVQKLGRQGDFRQQNKRLTPHAQAFGDGLKVHLGLARPGDPFKQRGAIAAHGHGGDKRVPRRNLVAHQPHRARRVKPGIGQIAGGVFLQHCARFHQTLDNAGRNPRFGCQFGQRERRTAIGLQHLQNLGAGIGGARRRTITKPVNPSHRRRIAQTRRTGGKPQHRRKRGQRIIGGTLQKGAQLIAHRGGIQHADDAAHLGQVIAADTIAPNHTQNLARPQRHLDKSAGKTAPLRRAVIQHRAKGAARGFGDQHGNQIALRIMPRLHARLSFAACHLALIHRHQALRTPGQQMFAALRCRGKQGQKTL